MLPEVRASVGGLRRDGSRALRPPDPDRRLPPATSRRPRSARPASTPGEAKVDARDRRVPAAQHRRPSRSPRQRAAGDRRLAARPDGADRSTPSRARSSSPGPPSSGCATGSALAATSAEVEALAGTVDRQRRGRSSCRRSSASARRTGIATRAARSVGLTRGTRRGRDRPGDARVDRLPGPRRRRGDGRRSRRRRSTDCGSTAAARAISLCQLQADQLGRAGRAAGRPRDDGVRGGGAGRARGRLLARPGRDRGDAGGRAAVRAGVPRATGERLLRGWQRAVERSRELGRAEG